MTTALAVTIAIGTAVNAALPDMALVPAGPQQSFFVTRGSTRAPEADRRQSVEVPAFLMDRTPVTRRQFAEFVRARPEWRRSQVTPVLTDSHYLEDWASDLDAGTRVPVDAPVTRVSWFAASAYCQWKGKELPTVDQWERAAAGDGKDATATREKILSWYSRPGTEPLRPVAREAPNAYGLHDLHGLIWEWTLDFNGSLVSAENGGLWSEGRSAVLRLGQPGSRRSGRLRHLHALCPPQQPEGQLHDRHAGLPLHEGDGAEMTWIRIALALALVVLPGPTQAKDSSPHTHGAAESPDGARPAPLSGQSIYQVRAAWTDTDGKSVQLRSLRGKPVVLAMVYTTCTTACPLTVADLKRIESALSPETGDACGSHSSPSTANETDRRC